ncbi:phosphatase PAP2 family protein [Pedobacter sp.]|uniref:phosphatase PAP2 family protein n=1 Tax=Pedobacter sp. TaxID=1411316 RepID=UPI0031DB3401
MSTATTYTLSLCFSNYRITSGLRFSLVKIMSVMKTLLLSLCLLPSMLWAQLADTVSFHNDIAPNPSIFRNYQPYIFPATLITYGIVSLNNKPLLQLDWSTKTELMEHNPQFVAKIDNYLQYTPLAGMYTLDMMGIKGRNSVQDQTFIALLSTGFTAAIVQGLKSSTGRMRPNGSNYNSFPSGHTATAFAAAEQLHQEFKDQSPWIGYAGFAVAAATGTLRMYNNKHWFSDVVAGAGFGILSTKLSYLVYPYLKHALGFNQQNFQAAPLYQNGASGISLKYTFNSQVSTHP